MVKQKKLITELEPDNTISKDGIECPRCKGSGILGDYVLVNCYQCGGIGRIFKGHKWKFLNI